MKVAVLTQPLGSNYGGILQAWALQRVLKDMGHAPIVVDRHFADRAGTFRRQAGRLKRVADDARLGLVGKASYWRHAPKLHRAQQQFISRHVARTGMIRSDQELRECFADNGFDAVIAGSDQVWRPRYSPSLEAYFLGFLDDELSVPRRVAYAASFGVGDWEFTTEQTRVCRELVQRFNGVSVREEAGVRLCAEHLGVAAEWVADPTLLHGKQDYIREFCGSSASGGAGVLTYILDPDALKSEIVDRLAATLGFSRFSRQPRPAQDIILREELAEYAYPPSDAWVRGFHECDFVVTDSFHGTLFSIIFRKPFIAVANPGRGLERFESILGLLGLSDRLVLPGSDLDVDALASPVDYALVEGRLDAFTSGSRRWLASHLGGSH